MRETIEWPIFALKLQQMRIAAGMTQKDLADISLVGEKTISTFESGARTNAISFAQLMDLTWACGYTVAEFIAATPFGFETSERATAKVRAKDQKKLRGKRGKHGPRLIRHEQAVAKLATPKRGITIFRSSDHLQSSLGEARR